MSPVELSLKEELSAYVNVDESMTDWKEKTPLKFTFVVAKSAGGATFWISTVPGFPGVRPCAELVMTVANPDVSETLLIPTEAEAFVTSTPVSTPDPPGVT